MPDTLPGRSRLSHTLNARTLPKKDLVDISRLYPAVSFNFSDIIFAKAKKLALHLKDLHREHHLTPDHKIEITQPEEKILNQIRYT